MALISRESIVGIVWVVILGFTLWFFNYLNRQNVFSRNMIITAEFTEIISMGKGTAVYIGGLEVGVVTAIYKEGDQILLDLDIDPDIRLPKNTHVMALQPSVLGGEAVNLIYEGRCTENCLESGDRIKGRALTYIDETGEAIGKAVSKYDTTASAEKYGKLLDNVIAMVKKTEQSTKSFSKTLNKSGKKGVSDLAYYQKMTADLKKKDINALLDSLNQQTASLKAQNYGKTITDARGSIKKLDGQITKVGGVLGTANNKIDSVSILIDKYTKEGILAKLLNDKDFKDSIQLKVQDIDGLIKRIKAHPERYLKLGK
ncbi:MAG: MCE family protein [Aureispira sp.]|nr:MCE family protein [Aureispira sp.]